MVYDDSSEKDHRAMICQEWFYDFVFVKGINLGISVGINVINIILKMILIKLVEIIRHDTKSKQMNAIKIGVFLTQFFNTGFLLVLATSNMSETNIPLLKSLFRGPYTDMTS